MSLTTSTFGPGSLPRPSLERKVVWNITRANAHQTNFQQQRRVLGNTCWNEFRNCPTSRTSSVQLPALHRNYRCNAEHLTMSCAKPTSPDCPSLAATDLCKPDATCAAMAHSKQQRRPHGTMGPAGCAKRLQLGGGGVQGSNSMYKVRTPIGKPIWRINCQALKKIKTKVKLS